MKQITFRCVCCRRIRPVNPRVKDQEYCGIKSCQQARKNKWQREKLQTDPDYEADINEKCSVPGGKETRITGDSTVAKIQAIVNVIVNDNENDTKNDILSQPF